MPVSCEEQQSHGKHDDDNHDEFPEKVSDGFKKIADEIEHGCLLCF